MNILPGQEWIRQETNLLGEAVVTLFLVKTVKEDWVTLESRTHYYKEESPAIPRLRYELTIKKDRMSPELGWIFIAKPPSWEERCRWEEEKQP